MLMEWIITGGKWQIPLVARLEWWCDSVCYHGYLIKTIYLKYFWFCCPAHLIIMISLKVHVMDQIPFSCKEPSCQCSRHKGHGFDPWIGKIPWSRAWQPTPVFLPGESHGQRSLVGCDVVLVSGVQQSESATCLQIYPSLLSLPPTPLLYYF